MGLCDYYYYLFKLWFLELSVVVVGPGALKPSDGNRIKSRRPQLHSRHSGFIYFDLSFFFLSLSIFAPIVVCVIIIIIIIIVQTSILRVTRCACTECRHYALRRKNV